MFVYGDVVYAQTWQVLTLKNCMEPFSYASTAYVVASALVSVRLFCKNLGNLQKFFGQMVYRPPWQKIARTPMFFCVASRGLCEFVRFPRLSSRLRYKYASIEKALDNFLERLGKV